VSGDTTSGSTTVDEMHCSGCERVREFGQQGWVIVRRSASSPHAAYCPDCMTKLVRDASGKDVGADD
jgi:hypothetical protein